MDGGADGWKEARKEGGSHGRVDGWKPGNIRHPKSQPQGPCPELTQQASVGFQEGRYQCFLINKIMTLESGESVPGVPGQDVHHSPLGYISDSGKGH